MTDLSARVARLGANRKALFQALLAREGLSQGVQPSGPLGSRPIGSGEQSLSATATPRPGAATQIPRYSRPSAVAMSHAQQRLWFVEQFDPGNPAYNCPVPVRLRGKLDRAALKSSLHELMARHEVLRTTYALQGGEPVQVVHRDLRMPLREHDISRLSPADQTRALECIVLLDANCPFDLANGPVVRAELIRIADDDHILMVDVHHIANDHWSIGIIFRELAASYNTRIGAEAEAIAPLSVQYADYSLWQRARLAGPIGTELQSYWCERLRGMRVLDLPTDRPRPPTLSHRGAIKYLRIPATLVQRLRELSKQCRASLFMTLLATFKLLLARYTGSDDIAVGCSATGRDRKELEALIGFFVNTVVLRTEVDQSGSFRDLLTSVRSTTLDAFANSEYPFDLLVQASNPQRSADRNPLVPVMFILDETPAEVARFSGLEAKWIEPSFQTTKFDLLVNARPDGDDVYAHFQYSTDLFEAATIERMTAQYLRLLEAVAATPDVPLSTFSLLSEEERELMLERWNDTRIELGAKRLIHEVIAERVARQPEATALVHGTQSYSYVELDRAATRLAQHLVSNGLASDELVAINLERSPEFVVAVLAVLRAGGAYVPLDPGHYFGQRLETTLQELAVTQIVCRRAQRVETGSRARVIPIEDFTRTVVRFAGTGEPREQLEPAAAQRDWAREGLSALGRRLTSGLPELAPKAISERLRRRLLAALSGGEAAGVSASANSMTEPVPRNERLAYVICSSGSTGRPKAIAIRHFGALNNLLDLNSRFGVNASDRLLFLSSPSFDMSVYETLGMLCAGATLVIPEAVHAKDPAHWVALLVSEKITLWNSAPALLELLVEELESHGGPVLADLRLVLLGGDWIPVSLPDRLRAFAPNVRFISLGGATEASIHSTVYEVDSVDPSWTSIPYGKPLANQKVFILDRERRPLPIGVPGELYLGGDGLARGYLGRDDLTREKFIEHSFGGEPPERLFKTGDLARFRPDGNIELIGRIDFQIKIHGLRVDLSEVEAVLCAHPAIKEAAVVASKIGPNDASLVAYYVLRPGLAAADDELRRHLGAGLPSYMVPSALRRLEALPTSSNGKIDRLALAAGAFGTSERTRASATTPLEKQLLEAWRAVLGNQDFGVDEDFFEVGGDSFAAIRLARKVPGSLPVVELFRHRTIRALALHIANAAPHSQDLLCLLTPRDRAASLTLICVPYGGGNVAAYQALAQELPGHIALWSVALPGHDPGRPEEDLESHRAIAERCCAEILRKVPGPFALYGQCAGASLVVELAALLEGRNRRPEAVYVGASLPDASPEASIERGTSALDDELHDYLKGLGGFDGALDDEDAFSVLRAVRHDLLEHSRFFARSYESPPPKLAAPIRCLVGERDIITQGQESRYREWDLFGNVELSVIARGNHYFVKHEAPQLARLLSTQHPARTLAAETGRES